MITFIQVLATVVAITLDVCSFAFLIRALMPIFTDVGDSKIYLFVCLITEPLIIPVRFLLVKFNLLQNSPIDWSFMLTYLLISVIRMFLPVI